MATIKAGTYRFNDVLSAPSASIREDFVWTSSGSVEGVGDIVGTFKGLCVWVYSDTGSLYLISSSLISSVPDLSGFGIVYPKEEDVFSNGVLRYQTITIQTDQEVSDEFYEWFTANATQPTAKVTYNGSAIANLFGGQTATLKCEGMKMESDVVIETGEDKVLAHITVTENGTYSEAYTTGTVSWSDLDEYDTTVVVDESIPLRVKKVDLCVPSSRSAFASDGYGCTVTLTDGTQQSLSMADLSLMEISENGILYGYIIEQLYYAVIWVKVAAAFNEMLGVDVIEDDSVYVTDYLFLVEESLAGATLTLKAPAKKADGISKVTVNVKPDPVTEAYIIQESADLPTDAIDGSFAFILGGE